MKGSESIEVVMKVLSEDAIAAMQVLCIPNMLEDSLAVSLLQNTGVANGNASSIIKRLRSFPIWHYRTIRTWAFDDDIREYCIDKLNGSGKEIRINVLSTLREMREKFEDFIAFNINDYDLQVARLALTIEGEEPRAMRNVRAIFELADRFNESETGRVIDLYLEEDIPEVEQAGKSLPEYVLNAFFMRGMYAYKKKDHKKALKFMKPVWEKAGRHDAAIAAHIVGLIWSKRREAGKDAERAYKSSLELFAGEPRSQGSQALVYHSLGNLLSKERNRWKEAEVAYNKSLELFAGQPLSQAQVYHSLGNLLSKERNRWKEAEVAYNKSLAFGKGDRQHEAQVYNDYGAFLSNVAKRWNEAEEAYNKSLELGKNDSYHKALVYHRLGDLLRKDPYRWKETENAYKQSFDLFNSLRHHEKFVKVCKSLVSFLLDDRGDYSSARKHIEFALEHERDTAYRKTLLSLLEEIDRAENSE
ncbi:MAG: tetratricopeptide repeat protein [Nitrospirae bacterium]|nr:tetratricopeptide repeat protein [Nitrospirota bacterium]